MSGGLVAVSSMVCAVSVITCVLDGGFVCSRFNPGGCGGKIGCELAV